VVYKLDAAGGKRCCTASRPGARWDPTPRAGVIGDSAGNLYGTTSYGGSAVRWRGVQAGCGGPGDRAVQLHGRGGWGQSLSRCDPRLGRQPLRHHWTLAAQRAGRGVRGECGWPGDGAVRLHGRDRWRLAPRGCDPRLGGQPVRDTYYTAAQRRYAGSGSSWMRPARRRCCTASRGGWPMGASPMAGVVRDSAGNLYGTTVDWRHRMGWGGRGVQTVDTTGQETVLHNFTGCTTSREAPMGALPRCTRPGRTSVPAQG
jgi:hypothetical protein